MCDLLDFEMRLWKSILNRKSSVDVNRGIRCDGLTGFMHRVRKSDAFRHLSFVRFTNRMLFAFGFLIADFNLHNRSIHVCKLDLGL